METPHQHTPGPWHLTRDQRGRPAVYVTPLYYGALDASAPINADANARLIAAAPDLLEHLERMVNIATHPKATMKQVIQIAADARAAIAKATTPNA